MAGKEVPHKTPAKTVRKTAFACFPLQLDARMNFSPSQDFMRAFFLKGCDDNCCFEVSIPFSFFYRDHLRAYNVGSSKILKQKQP
jgi:hypothetical protein